jgi:hypothetical protein
LSTTTGTVRDDLGNNFEKMWNYPTGVTKQHLTYTDDLNGDDGCDTNKEKN